MIRSLTINGYRGFKKFELHDLGRINLIVGTNNSGKTSILEAVNLLTSKNDYTSLWNTLVRRGEELDNRDGGRTGTRQIDIRRLFHGHELAMGSQFRIAAQSEMGNRTLEAVIHEGPDSKYVHRSLFDDEPSETGSPIDIGRPVSLSLNWGEPVRNGVVLSRRGGLTFDALGITTRFVELAKPNNRFIGASSLSPEFIIDLFDEVVLTPDEDLVLDALRIIEPSILRIATGRSDRIWSERNATRGGLLVKCEGVSDRIPIGSMGDGIWRLLGLALALVRTEGGVLLIDEIDTGLHYTVMENMWKLINTTAKRLNIQVFATTHSRDCYESLAVIAKEDVTTNSDVTIQRIERGKSKSVAYTEQEIVAAATRGMEVR